MKFTKKLFAVLFILMTMMTTILPTSALAASSTYKGSSSYSYTVKTGKKSATLTLKPVKGTLAQKYVHRNNSKKTKIDKWSGYATYSVTVNGKTYTVSNKNVKVTLPANGTYKVSIRYTGIFYQSAIHAAYNPFSYKTSGDQYWYKAPSIKVSVNNWAQIW